MKKEVLALFICSLSSHIVFCSSSKPKVTRLNPNALPYYPAAYIAASRFNPNAQPFHPQRQKLNGKQNSTTPTSPALAGAMRPSRHPYIPPFNRNK